MENILNSPHASPSDNIEDELLSNSGKYGALRLRATLAAKTWIGFDLDDTLHEFRRSSGKAIHKTLEAISERHGISMSALKERYSEVLKIKTAGAFSDGKTSFQYRRERFASVLAHFSVPNDDDFMNDLLEMYEATLTASLELKPGALDLLSSLRSMGKKTVIITEGPQDAQERTIQSLGIGAYVDFLATTNHFQVSKTDGLFSKVLRHLEISPEDMAYVGDSEQRDMEPAISVGIFSIHFDDKNGVSLNTSPPRINSLRELQDCFSG